MCDIIVLKQEHAVFFLLIFSISIYFAFFIFEALFFKCFFDVLFELI